MSKLLNYCNLPTIHDDCSLTFAEQPQIPFAIRRVYYIYDAKAGLNRGFHAHKENVQVFFCLRGSVTLLLDNGSERTSVVLNDPSKGVVIDKMVWHEMHDIQEDSLMLVFASHKYEASDYIRDYSVFLTILTERQV